MAIDPTNTNVVYLSVPVGETYEISRVTLRDNGKIKDKSAVTSASAKNNMRPYVIPGSAVSPLRLCWMSGDYYYWMVNRNYPQGFPTGIECDYDLSDMTSATNVKVLFDSANYAGETVQVNRDMMIGVDADNYLYIHRGRQTLRSECRYLSSDDWAHFSSGTSGDSWPTRIKSAHITLTEEDEYIVLRRNGAIEIKARL